MSVNPESSIAHGGSPEPDGWSGHLDAVGDGNEPSASAGEPNVGGPRSVVGIGAICDLRPAATAEDQTQSFSVSEFLLLSDGQRIILHTDRGFTLGVAAGGGALKEGETASGITQDVLNVVLPDDAEETGESHPWSWLADLAGNHAIMVTAEELRKLPYEVLLTDRVTQWIAF